MQVHREIVPRAAHESFRCFVREEKDFPFLWHAHPECELTLITAGRGWRYVGDHREAYRTGDLVLLGPGLPHTWMSKPAPRHRAIVLQFDPACLGAPLRAAPEFAAVRRLLAASARGLRLRGRLRDRIAAGLEALPAQPGLPRLLALLGLFHLIAESRERSPIASPAYRRPEREEEQRRLAPLLNHLHASFRDRLPAAQLARRFGASTSTLARCFRRGTGRTLVQYLNELRIGHAAERLLDTDLTVSEVCFASGFQNLSHFNRLFRAAHRLTPRAYRRKFRAGLGSETA
jgi:AraC-like DNA-binding protein